MKEIVLKSNHSRFIAILLSLQLLAVQGCSLFGKSDYATLDVKDVIVMVEDLPDMQKRTLAQSVTARKQLIDQFKKAYTLALGAEAEKLDKTDGFKKRRALSEDQVLASEFSRSNLDFNLSNEELTRYADQNKAQFEVDYAVITDSADQKGTDEQKDLLKLQWADMKIRAAKGREAGLLKNPRVTAKLKFTLANVLANLYTELLEQRNKLTPEEKQKYITEHPEADIEKLRERAQGLLDRLKKGEPFEKIADESNDDGTRGRGGDLDWFPKGRMDAEFEKVAFSLEKGQTTPELIKTSFGFHIIRVDDKRPLKPAAPAAPAAKPAAGTPTPTPSPTPGAPEFEVRARHIFVSAQEADTFERRLVDEKMNRAVEDATINYVVAVPADFPITVPGFNPNGNRRLGGGEGGTMRPGNPNDNR